MKPRVLVVSAEPVGARMAGPAIRAAELARALADDCEVTLAAPAPSALQDDRIDVVQAGLEDYQELLAACLRAEVVIAQQMPPRMLMRVARAGVRFVADLYNPTVVEVLENLRDAPPARRRAWAEITALAVAAHLAAADFVLCASERQRDLWLGGMALRGLLDDARYSADPSLRRVIDVVPFGVPDEPPPAPGAEPPPDWPGGRVLLWNGGVWPWLDAPTAIDAAARLHARDPSVSLVFLGMDRPLRDPRDRMTAGDEAIAHARERGVEGSAVHFRPGWVPYADRGPFLAAAAVGLSTHQDHLEARFSFRTRLLDCIWARLPIACTSGDALGDLVDHEGLGATAPPGDVEALAAACAGLLDDAGRAEAARAALDRLAPRLTWPEVVRPLREYCTHLADLPPLPRNDALLRSATLAQYPRLAREVLEDRGASAAGRKLAVNAARAAREHLRRT